MKEEFIKFFNDYDTDEIDKIKWVENIEIKNKVTYKNSLVENTIKYPLKESMQSLQKKQDWAKILGTNIINIDNANEILKRYDIATRINLKTREKKGYLLNDHNIVLIYQTNNKLVTAISKTNEIKIIKSFLYQEELELLPILYTLKYNLYNLFTLNTNGAITYCDNEKKELNEKITSKKSIKDSIISFSKTNDENNIKKIITAYYEEKNDYKTKEIKALINNYENEISEIVKQRSDITEEISNLNIAINDIKKKNISIINKVQSLEVMREEMKKLKQLKEDKTKQNKIDKFIKNNTEMFIEYSRDKSTKTIEEYVDKKIIMLYDKIGEAPSELKNQKEKLLSYLENDIINTYLIAIYYYLIMMLIKISENELGSIYEGNLINKAIFDIRELEDLIEIINKNLLY